MNPWENVEAAILVEAKRITKNKNLKMGDIVDWSSEDIIQEEGEKTYYLPGLNVNIAVRIKSRKLIIS